MDEGYLAYFRRGSGSPFFGGLPLHHLGGVAELDNVMSRIIWESVRTCAKKQKDLDGPAALMRSDAWRDCETRRVHASAYGGNALRLKAADPTFEVASKQSLLSARTRFSSASWRELHAIKKLVSSASS